MSPPTPEWITLIAALLVCLTAFSVLWGVSLAKNDVSIVDWYWGLGFAVIGVDHWILHGAPAKNAVLVAMVAVWSVRLTTYMVRRHVRKGREDARYAAMRAAGGPHFKRDSLFKIFWLQAVIMWIIATPLHAGLLYHDDVERVGLLAFGALLFLAGLVIESVADRQLDRFVSDPKNANRLMTGGLFAWSRHPNYFGEAMLWWGLGLVGFAFSGLWWSFVGPAILTLLLLKVSGVPMLEDLLRQRPGWDAYAARTPAFFPRPPRRADEPTAKPDAIT